MLLEVESKETISAVRPVKTIFDIREKANQKLLALSEKNFIGTEKEIYKLSIIYDKMFLKYTGVIRHALSPKPVVARKSKNWKSFQRLYALLSAFCYPEELYIEVQFKAFRGRNFGGKTYPYPNMLAGMWAEENYNRYIQEKLETGMLASAMKSESSKIAQQLKSSVETVESFRKANPDLTELQLLIMLENMLSPIYLLTNTTFLNYINSTNTAFSEDMIAPLIRMRKDKDFYQTVLSVAKEVKGL